MKNGIVLLLLVLTTVSCNLSTPQTSPTVSPSPMDRRTSTGTPSSASATVVPPTKTVPSAPTSASTPLPVPTNTPVPIPTVESLKAKVTAALLSCRYGPGAEYLYLYALRAGANIKLIGRAEGNDWVWVDGTNRCWVKASFLAINGDRMSLPVVYPGIAKLPITPYYPAPSWASATRTRNSVEINWEPVPISPGKYEDENMHQYIVEVWRCEKGQIIFETLGTNFPFLTVQNDEPGCSQPSHATVWLQEKHGFAGPVKVPWPQPATTSQADQSTNHSCALRIMA